MADWDKMDNLGIWISVATIIGAAIGAGISRFWDKSNWRDVAESRGEKINDLEAKQKEIDSRVKYLEAQVQGLITLKSEQIAHLVVESIQSHGLSSPAEPVAAANPEEIASLVIEGIQELRED